LDQEYIHDTIRTGSGEGHDLSMTETTDTRRTTNERPTSLFPLDFKEALAALLRVKTKPPVPKKKTQKRQKPGD
jgi:hypothetical protein